MMFARRVAILCLILSMFTTSGCWDLTEPNQLAFVIGTALDITKDGQVQVSVQVPVPKNISSTSQPSGGGGGGSKPYTVISAKGNTVFDAMQKIQEKISRSLFPGHRIAIFISEQLARNGIDKWLDELKRNPESETRAKLYIVKGQKAKTFLENEVALEQFSAVSAVHTEKFLGITQNRIYVFRRETDDLAFAPFVPAISMKGQEYRINGLAVFNTKKKLVGFLTDQDAWLAWWMTGKLMHRAITQYISAGKGYVTLDLQNLNSDIDLSIKHDQIKANLKLTAMGIVRENSTSLNLLMPQDRDRVQNEINEITRQQIQHTVSKMQQQYNTDIFGFGDAIYRKYPEQWEKMKMKQNWDQIFPHIHVTVQVAMNIHNPGYIGSGEKH